MVYLERAKSARSPDKCRQAALEGKLEVVQLVRKEGMPIKSTRKAGLRSILQHFQGIWKWCNGWLRRSKIYLLNVLTTSEYVANFAPQHIEYLPNTVVTTNVETSMGIVPSYWLALLMYTKALFPWVYGSWHVVKAVGGTLVQLPGCGGVGYFASQLLHSCTLKVCEEDLKVERLNCRSVEDSVKNSEWLMLPSQSVRRRRLASGSGCSNPAICTEMQMCCDGYQCVKKSTNEFSHCGLGDTGVCGFFLYPSFTAYHHPDIYARRCFEDTNTNLLREAGSPLFHLPFT
eukprot:g19662.t1